MYEKADLQRMTGFSTDQLNDRLGRLRPHFGNDFHSGKRSKVLVTERVAAALRRMRELEDDGLGPQDAIGRILSELDEPQENGHSGDSEGWRMLAEERQQMIKSLQQERDRLLGIIEDQSDQIRALMPGRSEDHGAAAATSGDVRQRSADGKSSHMSRWEAFRYALFGV